MTDTLSLFDAQINDRDAKWLLDAGAYVNAVDENGVTPLIRQCEAGNLPMIKLLLEAGADVNQPLIRQCEIGNLPVVKLLLEAGADANRPCASCYGRRPIHFAATVDIARLLIERGAEVDAADNFRVTPLVAQVNRRPAPGTSEFAQYLGIVELLIEHGADVNARDEDGRCALEIATAYDMIKLLIDHGADATAVNLFGQSLLCYRDDVRVIDLLAEHGASPTLVSADGTPPITFVSTVEAAEALIRHGADVNVLSYAMEPEVAMFLLEHGADVNGGGKKDGLWGWEPPLFNFNRTLELTREMLRRGADVNCRDSWGRTLLHCCRSFEEAELLLEFGADINARAHSWDHRTQPWDHRTPLHSHCDVGCVRYRPENWELYSEEAERVKIIRFLLEHGADVHAKDDNGRTPLYYCPRYDREVLCLLKSYGADAWENYDLGEEVQ